MSKRQQFFCDLLLIMAGAFIFAAGGIAFFLGDKDVIF